MVHLKMYLYQLLLNFSINNINSVKELTHTLKVFILLHTTDFKLHLFKTVTELLCVCSNRWALMTVNIKTTLVSCVKIKTSTCLTNTKLRLLSWQKRCKFELKIKILWRFLFHKYSRVSRRKWRNPFGEVCHFCKIMWPQADS